MDRDSYAPIHVIMWRFIWIVPLMVARMIFVACVFLMYGDAAAARAWRDTK